MTGEDDDDDDDNDRYERASGSMQTETEMQAQIPLNIVLQQGFPLLPQPFAHQYCQPFQHPYSQSIQHPNGQPYFEIYGQPSQLHTQQSFTSQLASQYRPICWSNTLCGSIPSILDGKQPPTIPSFSKQKRSDVNDLAYTINDASLGVGTNNEVGANASEFETFIDNGLNGLPEPYLFEQDVDGDGDSDSVFDLDGDSDSDTDSHSGDLDGEGESGCELDGDSDGDGDVNCDCELDVDSDGCGQDRGDSFAAPLPWIIPGAEKPVGHKSEWGVPEDISSIVVNVSPWVSQAGRPKKSRIPSSGEYRGKKSRTCS
ncbi:hypothetical protein Ddye_007503 [Dipteronia dyeriana]|uniref:Uncharacterized protein n=1 Tax=Dipteronia dyeriana TaxID=168575 RepID=A0AAE0CRI8_9ROSI|nr:hypothetical protein Ddye_007503 [Dipteronia dyeriana]